MKKDRVCEGCGCLVDTVQTVPEGEVWVRHERMARGPAGWRWRTGEASMAKLEVGPKLCHRCRGVARPDPPMPLWRQAAAAWESASPEVRAMAPRLRRA